MAVAIVKNSSPRKVKSVLRKNLIGDDKSLESIFTENGTQTKRETNI